MAESWLLADIGGTNTRLGLAGPDGLDVARSALFPNLDFPDPPALFRHYLRRQGLKELTALCAGVAGPVRQGHARLTNGPWLIESAALAKATGAQEVYLLNDLQVQGYALDDIPPGRIIPLFPGSGADDKAARLVMGLGTGSNVAVVHRIGADLFVPPAESGHACLPHAPGRLGELIRHLGQTHGHHPMEAALSGPGLSRIHGWLTGAEMTPADILSAYREGQDGARETLWLFADLLGRVAGDLALAHLPMGGLCFIGGTARAVAPILSDTDFHARFCDKGPYRALLEAIPISLIDDDMAALTGCARYLRQRQMGR